MRWSPSKRLHHMCQKWWLGQKESKPKGVSTSLNLLARTKGPDVFWLMTQLQFARAVGNWDVWRDPRKPVSSSSPHPACKAEACLGLPTESAILLFMSLETSCRVQLLAMQRWLAEDQTREDSGSSVYVRWMRNDTIIKDISTTNPSGHLCPTCSATHAI